MPCARLTAVLSFVCLFACGSEEPGAKPITDLGGNAGTSAGGAAGTESGGSNSGGSAGSSGSGATGAMGGSSVGANGGSNGGSGGSGGSGGGVSLRILFIGNSYTYVNDLPSSIQSFVSSSKLASLEVDSWTVGGATLADHVNSTEAIAKIQAGGWTHVVLQGQSLEPLWQPTVFEDAAKTLGDEVNKVGAVPLFYETWARKEGDSNYAETWSGGTPAAMQQMLRDEYNKAAMVSNGVVVPAGDAWEKTLAEHPSINLFDSDGSHPSPEGTYLVGCVFYSVLMDKSPVGLSGAPVSVSAADAEVLQEMAAQTVGVSP